MERITYELRNGVTVVFLECARVSVVESGIGKKKKAWKVVASMNGEDVWWDESPRFRPSQSLARDFARMFIKQRHSAQ